MLQDLYILYDTSAESLSIHAPHVTPGSPRAPAGHVGAQPVYLEHTYCQFDLKRADEHRASSLDDVEIRVSLGNPPEAGLFVIAGRRSTLVESLWIQPSKAVGKKLLERQRHLVDQAAKELQRRREYMLLLARTVGEDVDGG